MNSPVNGEIVMVPCPPASSAYLGCSISNQVSQYLSMALYKSMELTTVSRIHSARESPNLRTDRTRLIVTKREPANFSATLLSSALLETVTKPIHESELTPCSPKYSTITFVTFKRQSASSNTSSFFAISTCSSNKRSLNNGIVYSACRLKFPKFRAE